MIARQIRDKVLALSTKYPVLALTGPRQSGKTTLLKNLFADYQYVSLEDPDVREFAQTDPKEFLKRYPSKVIFDEVQRVPHLFSYIQTLVDASGEMGQFILSGSQNFQLLRHITQSLAGRVALFKLLPLDFTELKGAQLLPDEFTEILIKGSYPAIFDRDIDSTVFYANYLQTYIERDVVELLNIKDLRKFRDFIGLCAARCGQLLNFNALSNECNISQPTAKAWLSLLESSYIVFQLPPYPRNFNKRITKTPKLYFYDTGLVCYLLGIKTITDLDKFRGSLFENLIIAEFHKQNEHKYLHQDFHFWRDANGNEVDLLIPKGLGFDIFEIKASKTIQAKQFTGLDYLQKLNLDAVSSKTLIYGGTDSQKRLDYSIRGWNEI